MAAEEYAVASGRHSLMEFMITAPHVGTSPSYRARAEQARLHEERGASAYCLTTLYFSGGYFGTRQAIELDALRYAIDQVIPGGAGGDRDWLLSAWIATAAAIINAPGHTAQFLKPASEKAYRRIRSNWSRGVWSTFLDQAKRLQPCGDRNWRLQNRISSMDALEFVEEAEAFETIGLVYADPPYTEDQYSRYYHVYETLYLYDYPDSVVPHSTVESSQAA
jgi:adenine-specific DNA-methyltransferase